MKRFQLLVMVAAITAAVIWWGLYRSRHTTSTGVAALLPKETLAFVHLPDFNRSRAELRQTDLYQIWLEPGVQDFLRKPRSKIPVNDGFASTIRECESLQMKDAFLAVVTIQDSAWKIVGGFRFQGDPGDAEKVVANWTSRFLGNAPDSKREIGNYEGHQIQTDTTGIVSLSTVRSGQWFFVANDPDQLKPMLDRADGRTTDSDTTLIADDQFAAAAKHMPSIYTALGFARVDQFVEKLMPVPENGGPAADQMAAIRQIRSVCATTSFDGGKIRDAIFVGMPKLLEAGTLTRASLPIASKDAFLYAAGFLNLTKPIPFTNSALGAGGLQKVITALSSSGVTLETWNSAFGPEMSWIGNWSSNSHWPSLFATLPVRDSAKAREVLTTITTANADSTEWTKQEKGGVQYFSTRTGMSFISLSPTIGLSDRMLVAGPNTAAVEAAMKRIAEGTSELAASKDFKAAEHAVPAAEQMFSYINPALIYSRIDATLRPVLLMSAAFLPGIADLIDSSKLPAPETITRHLSPIVMSQRYDRDGYISESIGPVTAYQTIIGIGGLGGAATMLYQRQTRGPTSSSMPSAIIPAPAASASPSASPGESPK